jgi:uncharacterized phage-associated protein
MMASVDDVAAAILDELGEMDTFKLEKLVYYCQAWHLVWERQPLFPDRIEAWANGPVVPTLFQQHKGMLRVSQWPNGDPTKLTPGERSTINAVLKFYGKRQGHVLAALTHREAPWRDARVRAGVRSGERGTVEIRKDAMLEYYEGLVE